MPSGGWPVLQRLDGPALVLASASPTRVAMLRAAGLRFDQEPAAVDEAAMKDALRAEQVPPADAAVALAELKAARIAARHQGDVIVLGADQILTCAGAWFDKPADRAEARAHLERLAGRRHELTSAVVGFRGGVRVWHHVAAARLWMRPCSPAFLEAYLDAVGEAALGSVGAYQIEGPGAQLFARIEGDRFAILGLPLLEVLEFLRQQGVLLA
jgi:septum formation protein